VPPQCGRDYEAEDLADCAARQAMDRGLEGRPVEGYRGVRMDTTWEYSAPDSGTSVADDAGSARVRCCTGTKGRNTYCADRWQASTIAIPPGS
jgi:hypothetical protein